MKKLISKIKIPTTQKYVVIICVCFMVFSMIVIGLCMPVNMYAQAYESSYEWNIHTLSNDPASPLVESRIFAQFIEGYPDGTFRGNNEMSREEFITILAKIFNPEGIPRAAPVISFSDVPGTRWSRDAVQWAVDVGIIDAGITDARILDAGGAFRPVDAITRAEVANMLARAEGWTETAENIFSDIDDHRYFNDILKSVAAGIFIGYPDGTFSPDNGITRYELVAAMVRYLLDGEPDDEMILGIVLEFPDVPHTHWALSYVALTVTGSSEVEPPEEVNGNGYENGVNGNGYNGANGDDNGDNGDGYNSDNGNNNG